MKKKNTKVQRACREAEWNRVLDTRVSRAIHVCHVLYTCLILTSAPGLFQTFSPGESCSKAEFTKHKVELSISCWRILLKQNLTDISLCYFSATQFTKRQYSILSKMDCKKNKKIESNVLETGRIICLVRNSEQ